MQVLVIGKISQAAVVAASAYKDQEGFQRQTGITKSCLIDDKLHRNTKVQITIMMIITVITTHLYSCLVRYVQHKSRQRCFERHDSGDSP